MPKVETNKSYWLSVSEEFFKADFKTPKEFYEHFVDSSVLYYEIGKRLVAASIAPLRLSFTEDLQDSDIIPMVNTRAYRLMNEAFREDVANNDQLRLEELVLQYRDHIEKEGE